VRDIGVPGFVGVTLERGTVFAKSENGVPAERAAKEGRPHGVKFRKIGVCGKALKN
jgi:hypothetical protein